MIREWAVAVGLTVAAVPAMAQTPKRGSGRLSRRADFDRVYRQGRAVSNRHPAL